MRAALEVDLGRPLPDDHEARCGAELFVLFRRELRAVHGITQAIAAVNRAGHACCVASSSSPERLTLALDVTGLSGFFGANVFSSTLVPHGKPAPDLFLYAADKMGFTPAISVVVEDSISGIKAARSAGMYAIGFTGGTHCAASHRDDLSRAGADRIAVDAAELALALSEDLVRSRG
jgi:HAD superfamily hydrolase (TIGR01509 family)